ncbi:cation:proton antiporter, partial [Reyranella sp.]|uniref:cation:proton antiporter domain-containing protein n=1 Tax=Reyranella sp. TaxID=1929291 RepID=UPI003D11F47C
MTNVETSDYGDVVLFLITAGFVVPLFRQWKLSPILGFLAAGVLLGPSGLGALQDVVPWLSYFTIKNPRNVAQLADLGVVFLLFSIGLELSWERLLSLCRRVFGLGGLQGAFCSAVIAAAAI